MTAIGVTILIVCFILINYVFDNLYGNKHKETIEAVIGGFVIIGVILTTVGIAIKLWEIMP